MKSAKKTYKEKAKRGNQVRQERKEKLFHAMTSVSMKFLVKVS